MSLFSSIFGGASAGQTQLAKEQTELFGEMMQHYGTSYSQNQLFQQQIDAAWQPILAGGAYQYGFSVPEDQLLQNEIRTEGAQQTTNTINAEELRQQQATGGASAGPTGGQQAIEAMAAQQEAQSTAQSLAREKLAGYQQGNTNFLNATNVKQGLLANSNPNAYGSTAIAGGGLANQSQQEVTQANQNSLTAKLIGGAVQGGLAFATGGLSSMAGGGGFMAGGSNAFGGPQ